MNDLENILKTKFEAFDSSDPYVAASGGVDSTVLAHLLVRIGLKPTLLHVNYHQRGDESDGDQKFVELLAQELDLDCQIRHFPTDDYSGNFQEAARDFRYDWFHSMEGKILTAHTSDDVVETFYMNLSKGAGLKGLSSIPERNQNVYRPLLSVSKQELLAYAEEHGLNYRVDSSNLKSDYKRNALRNNALPSMREVLPTLDDGTLQAINHLKEANEAWKIAIEQVDAIIEGNNKVEFTSDYLKLWGFKGWLLERGFSSKQAEVIVSRKTRVGSEFRAENNTVFVDRDSWSVKSIGLQELESVVLDLDKLPSTLDFGRYQLTLKLIENALEDAAKEAIKSPDKECFQVEEQSQITVRQWREGDRIQPLGMMGSKLVSDIFIDSKVALTKKQEVPVIVANNDVIAVLGLCISEKVKVKDAKRSCLIIEWVERH